MTEKIEGLTGLRFGLSDSLGAGSVGYARWLARVAGDPELRCVRGARWWSDISVLSFGENFALFRGASPGGEEVLLQHGLGDPPILPGVAHVRRDASGQIDALVAARYDTQVDAWLEWLRGLLEPRQDKPGQTRVPVTFWALGPHGPNGRQRRIDVRGWEQIAANYSRDLADGLGHLVGAGFQPGAGGQLVVWHGPPGTGKTWALRALAWEWRHWCDMHYVTDPEVFFGGEANYMMEVLLGQDYAVDLDDEMEVRADPRADGGRWRCLILEDTGELLQADARAQSGQGLSRLLNVVDGMIGQGLRVLALLTTNEQLRTLHPAVSRPGRCAAHIEFGALPETEARLWLDAHEYDQALGSGSRTIAELYELADQHAIHQHADRDGLGFR